MTGRLGQIAARDRIVALDVLRGLAILLIFIMNIPWMGQLTTVRPDVMGWTAADRWAWWGQRVVLDGTQRGLLELLFGAGMVIMARRAMTPDGPVAVADAYYRRNLWLAVFGLAHVFGFLWFGEILFPYGLAALLIFQFRTVAARPLLIGATALLVLGGVGLGAKLMAARATLLHDAPAALADRAAHRLLADGEAATVQLWDNLVDSRTGTGKLSNADRAAHQGGFAGYYAWATGEWTDSLSDQLEYGLEAALTMLIGVALFKWGVVQGDRSARFYLGLLLACYAAGLPLRLWEAHDILAPTLAPQLSWLIYQPARLLMTLGHLGLINLLLKTQRGAALLRPFQAAGRLPLTIYFGQSVLGMWVLFAPFGLGLWGRFSWAGLTLIAFAVMALQLAGANLLLRHFDNGPFEWAWKSLAYVRRQPLRRAAPHGLAAPAE